MFRSEKECEEAINELLEVDAPEKDKKNLELNKSIDSVFLSPQHIIYQGKQVRQITLIGYFLQKNPGEDELAATRVVIQFNDGSHIRLRFKNPTFENQERMYLLLRGANGICEQAFHNYGSGACSEEFWKGHALTLQCLKPLDSLDFSRFNSVRAYYDRTHASMAKNLLENVKENPDYSAKAANGVCFISLCCGAGKEMQVCCDAFRDAGFKNCTAIGFDSSQYIIEMNKKNKTPHRFIQANIENIENELKRLIHSGELNVDGKLVVFIASGALARDVMNGTRVVLEVMQVNIGDILIAAGYSPSLITQDGAIASGWDIKAQNYCAKSDDEKDESAYRQLYICQRQSAAREFEVMLERSKIREKDPKVFSTLDLSFASNPLQRCNVFLDKKPELVAEVVQIDLSWSHLSKDKIPELLSLFVKFPKLKYVTISGYEAWSGDFIRKLRENISSFSFTLLQRLDSTHPDELPTIPVHLCKQLGIYSIFPHKIILKGAANPEKQAELKVDKKSLLLKLFSADKFRTTAGRTWATPKPASTGPYANHDVACLTFEEEGEAKEVEKRLNEAHFFARILPTKSGKPSVTVDLTVSNPRAAR